MADHLLMPLGPDPLRWPLSLREEWEERAAIIEVDGAGCSRSTSEYLAARIVRRRVEQEERIVYPALRSA